ncbi:DUF2545 family protein [Escherichia coli]
MVILAALFFFFTLWLPGVMEVVRGLFCLGARVCGLLCGFFVIYLFPAFEPHRLGLSYI